MPLDFPNSPTVNQTFTSGSRTWTWTGTVWNLVGGSSLHAASHASGGLDPITIAQSQVTGLSTVLSAKADRTSGTSFPASPTIGQIHVNTTTKCTYIYNGSVWDELSRPNPIEPLLLIGI